MHYRLITGQNKSNDSLIAAEIRGTLLFELHAERVVFLIRKFRVRAILMSICLDCAVIESAQFIVFSVLHFVRKSWLG